MKSLSDKWNEAKRRAETYLRVSRGDFGLVERQLVDRAIELASVRSAASTEAHPVTLVMDALFRLLPLPASGEKIMTPAIRRTSMLPERTEFPVHDFVRRQLARLTVFGN